ncbi:MAG TPA: hypothetical protein VJT72_15010 [Pseudonocardiaceae bacterium]|nr:hypothetical protein [Pseudonocardiaceae bacterium]
MSDASSHPVDRRLVMHMGMNKAGSTSLQIGFVRNRDRLAEYGVHYPPHRSDAAALRGAPLSGNGPDLRPLLQHELHPAPAEMGRMMDRFLATILEGPAATILYSSEELYRFDEQCLHEFAEKIRAAGIRLQVVLVVRDVTPYLLSAYSQQVRRHRFTGSFWDYVTGEEGTDYPLRHLAYRPKMRALHDVLDTGDLLLVHYDSARDSLLERFLAGTFGLQDLSGLEVSAGTVNRGLTASEAAVLRQLNTRTDEDTATVIAWLMQEQPARGARLAVSAREFRAIEEMYGDDVAWVNAQLFRAEVLGLAGDVAVLSNDDETRQPSHDALMEQFTNLAYATHRIFTDRQRLRDLCMRKPP